MAHFILHIGTHKTGSTSIQSFLQQNESYLQSNGLAFLPGPNGKPNFKTLFHASCAPDRRALMALKQPGPLGRLFLKQRIRKHLARAARRHPGLGLVVSTELLSLLRLPGEMEMLRSVFPPDSSLTVVVCLRQKHAFLASMQRQMDAQKISRSNIQGSSNYIEKDSWLADYGSMLEGFCELTPDLRIVDYDAAFARGDNIILPFLQALGISVLPTADKLPFLNKRA